MGTEDTTVNFNLYRIEGRLSPTTTKLSITASTNYLDKIDTTKAYTYMVKALVNDKEEKNGESIIVSRGLKKYLSIPLKTPQGYSANDASVGDMDGDGVYEIVIHMAGKRKR